MIASCMLLSVIVRNILHASDFSEAWLCLRSCLQFAVFSLMASTVLTVYVGLSNSDACRLFDQGLSLEPYYLQRWGLKPSVTEAEKRD